MAAIWQVKHYDGGDWRVCIGNLVFETACKARPWLVLSSRSELGSSDKVKTCSPRRRWAPVRADSAVASKLSNM